MAKCFSKKYGNKGWALNYLQSKSYVKMPVSTWCYIPTSLPQEWAAKTNMVSVVRIQLFSGVGNTCLRLTMLPWSWKNTTLAGYNGDGLATGLLVSNSWIQLTIAQYWWWFWRQWCRDVVSGADRHLDITFGLQVVESSSLVSVLFREVFSHPYISFFIYVLLYLPHTRSASRVKWSGLVSIYMCMDEKKKFESYFSDRLTFLNIHSRTSRRIYD